MNTENLSTLKIHKLTKAQYVRERDAGNLDENALYLTPDDSINLSEYAKLNYVDENFALKSDIENIDLSEYETKSDAQTKFDSVATGKQNKLTGAEGQVVGFDSEGNAVAQDNLDEFDLLLEAPTIGENLTGDQVSIIKGNLHTTREKVERGEPVRVAIRRKYEYYNDLWDYYMYATQVDSRHNTGTEYNGLHISFAVGGNLLIIEYQGIDDGVEETPNVVRFYKSYINSALPIERGGTNATTAEKARKNLGATATVELTQAEYDALGVYDENTLYVITDGEGEVATSAEEVQVTLPTSWSNGKITVNVEGVTGDPNQPIIVDMNLTGTDKDADIAVMEAWGCVNRAYPGVGTITFECYGDTPTIAIPLNVVVM